MGFDRERIVRLACEMLADPPSAREVHSPTRDDPLASGAHAASFVSSTPEASLVPAPRVLMLAGDFAEDYEVMVPYQALGMLGVDVDVVCPCKACGDTIKTAVHDFLGDQTYAETPGHRFALTAIFAEAVTQPSRYDGLYLAGGRAPEYLRLNKDVLSLVRAAFALGLPVAAICHGIQVLTAADVVRGRKLTCYAAVAPEVRAAGGTYVEVAPTETVRDGMLVTSPAWPGHQTLLAEFANLLGIRVTREAPARAAGVPVGPPAIRTTP